MSERIRKRILKLAATKTMPQIAKLVGWEYQRVRRVLLRAGVDFRPACPPKLAALSKVKAMVEKVGVVAAAKFFGVSRQAIHKRLRSE